MDEWLTPESVIDREPAPGEKLIWSGRPSQGIMLRAYDALLIPFSLLWTGFAVFWEYSAIASGDSFAILWGLPFVALGLYITVGRFALDAKRRQRTFYGLTNQRVTVIAGIVSRKVTSLNLRTVSNITLSEKHDGKGTISFGPIHPMAWCWESTLWAGVPHGGPSFEMIFDAKKVYEQIRAAEEPGRNHAAPPI